MTSGQELLIERQDTVLKITLNRPRALNAFTRGMLKDCRKALLGASADSSLRVVIITGDGPGFCVGADLGRFREEALKGVPLDFRKDLEENFNPVVRLVKNLPQIVIARINGTCAGAGLALALGCDIRYALANTRFVGAFIKVGLIPDVGSSYFFTKAMGYSKALEFFLLKDRISASELLPFGLINQTFEAIETMDQEIDKVIARLKSLPPQALTLTKRVLRAASQADHLEAALSLEAMAQGFLGETQDHAEGVTSFLEKRNPVFKGL